MLTEKGAQRSTNRDTTRQPNSSSPTNESSQSQPSNIANEQGECNRWKRFEKFCTTYLINQGNSIDKKMKEQDLQQGNA